MKHVLFACMLLAYMKTRMECMCQCVYAVPSACRHAPTHPANHTCRNPPTGSPPCHCPHSRRPGPRYPHASPCAGATLVRLGKGHCRVAGSCPSAQELPIGSKGVDGVERGVLVLDHRPQGRSVVCSHDLSIDLPVARGGLLPPSVSAITSVRALLSGSHPVPWGPDPARRRQRECQGWGLGRLRGQHEQHACQHGWTHQLASGQQRADAASTPKLIVP